MSRGTAFNPSSPSAPVIGKRIKTQICKNARVPTRPNLQSPPDNEKSCLNIIKYAQSSLPTLKTRILNNKFGAARRMYAVYVSPIRLFMSL